MNKNISANGMYDKEHKTSFISLLRAEAANGTAFNGMIYLGSFSKEVTVELKAVKEPVMGRSGGVQAARRACAKALRLQEGAGHTQGAARPVWPEHHE